MTVTRTVGVDIGGTRTKVVALEADAEGGGAPVAETVLPTPADVKDTLVEHVRRAIASVSPPDEGYAVAAVGVVVPGLVDERAGVGVWSGNLGWRDLPLRGLVQEAVLEGTVVVVGHDVRAGLVGEHRFGAAQEHDNVIFVPLGTGVAAAVMVGGRVAVGSPWSGEIGHVVLDPDGPWCVCGQRGCLEAVAGAAGLTRLWQQAGQEGDASVVTARAREGDPLAQRLWDDAVTALAEIIAPAAALVGAEMILVGGGMSNAGDQLLVPLRTELAQRLPLPDVEVERARLGDRAAALGAAVLAGDALRRCAEDGRAPTP